MSAMIQAVRLPRATHSCDRPLSIVTGSVVDALQHHAERVAHQQHVDPGLVEDPGERRVVAGQHRDLIAGRHAWREACAGSWTCAVVMPPLSASLIPAARSGLDSAVQKASSPPGNGPHGAVARCCRFDAREVLRISTMAGTPAFSARRSVLVVPGMGTMSSPCASSQASASCEAVQPFSRAMASICLTSSRFFAKFPPWKRGERRR